MQHTQPNMLSVYPCKDFLINGKGSNAEWHKTAWTDLVKLDKGGADYISQFKILYSHKGVYILFTGEDSRISSGFEKDFDELYKGDVFEIFFHPEPADPIYFEYEISPLEKELVLLMVNTGAFTSGWAPWPYGEEHRVIKKITVSGGSAKPFTQIKSWTAELFIPHSLLCSFKNTPPVKGTIWKANFCRLDYDTGEMVKWAWAPVQTSFHETDRYFSLFFE